MVRRILGSEAKIFVDANAVWDQEQAISKLEAMRRFDIWAAEEPLRARQPESEKNGQSNREAVLDDNHYKRYTWLRERSPVPLIADESFISLAKSE